MFSDKRKGTFGTRIDFDFHFPLCWTLFHVRIHFVKRLMKSLLIVEVASALTLNWRPLNELIIIIIITLRAELSGAVYCCRSCLWRAGGRRVFVGVFVGLLPR